MREVEGAGPGDQISAESQSVESCPHSPAKRILRLLHAAARRPWPPSAEEVVAACEGERADADDADVAASVLLPLPRRGRLGSGVEEEDEGAGSEALWALAKAWARVWMRGWQRLRLRGAAEEAASEQGGG
jgi:hypothetical protein